MRAMIVKEFRELVRDRRTLTMLVALPLLLLIIFGYAANFYVSTVKVAVVGAQADQVATTLPPFFSVTRTDPSGDRTDAEKLLRDNTVDVAFVTGTPPVLALVDGSNLFAAQASVAALNKAGGAVKTQVLYNPELKTSWVMVPAIIGLILTFIGTIITSIGLVREREAGTLEQLAVMPIRPSTVSSSRRRPPRVPPSSCPPPTSTKPNGPPRSSSSTPDASSCMAPTTPSGPGSTAPSPVPSRPSGRPGPGDAAATGTSTGPTPRPRRRT
jgi:ABC-2 type transport system permease protein